MEMFFSPSLHKQRHQFVLDFVRKNKPKKVVDLGCNDCSLLRKLKFHRNIELLAGVDINPSVVKRNMHALAPIPTDYLQPGASPLSIELYQGSVTQMDPRLRGFDLVTSVELIEHLHLADVERFSEVVFGFMNPLFVIVSTPNSEFNPLFPRMAGFRHYDHKFEWTRAEFQCWAQKACVTYGYKVEFTGVGEPPTGQQDNVGFCSQIGNFTRLCGKARAGDLPSASQDETLSYTLLYSVAYPSLCDNNILRRTLATEVLYWAAMLGRQWLENNTLEADEALHRCQDMDGNETEMREMMYPRCRDPVLEERLHRDQEHEAGSTGLEFYRHERGVCVPLARLWTCCPRIKSLSGSLQNLRQLILDNPLVRLTQNGTAVLLQDPIDQDDYEEECDTNVTGLTQCVCADEKEDWEAEL